MAVIPFYTKFPTESFPVGLDFSDEMPVGTPTPTLASGVCSAIYRKTELTATAVLLAGGTTATVDAANNIARIIIDGGVAGTWYEVHFAMTCSQGSLIKGKAVVFVDN